MRSIWLQQMSRFWRNQCRERNDSANIPKNRCRTTIPERMVETLAELPFIGDQVICLSHDQAARLRRMPSDWA
jgi:hypothetical protein